MYKKKLYKIKEPDIPKSMSIYLKKTKSLAISKKHNAIQFMFKIKILTKNYKR